MDVRVLCLSNRFYYDEMNQEDVKCIKHDLELYHKMLHKAYRLSYDICFHELKLESMQKYMKKLYGTSDYLPLSAIHEAKAILKSNIGTNKRLQKQCGQTIKIIKKKIKETKSIRSNYESKLNTLIQKCKDMEYTEKDYLFEVQVVKPKIKELKNREKQLTFKLNKYEFKLMGLKKRVKQCCFTKSNTRMMIPGRSQGRYCNNLFKYHVDTGTMQVRTSQRDVYLPIVFHHNHEELLRVMALKHATPHKAVAYELRDYGKYFIIKAIIQAEEKNALFDASNGVVGLDLNVDHFAMVETNGEGNIINRKIIRYQLKGKISNQRLHILRNKAKEVVMFCKGKPLVIEKLNFDKKKSKMMYQNKRYNQALSEFAYKRIRQMIESRCYKDDVVCMDVEPAYTSQIGRLKYMKPKGLSIHESAAYVIARRGMGYKEKVTKEYKSLLNAETKRYSYLKQWEYLSKVI